MLTRHQKCIWKEKKIRVTEVLIFIKILLEGDIQLLREWFHMKILWDFSCDTVHSSCDLSVNITSIPPRLRAVKRKRGPPMIQLRWPSFSKLRRTILFSALFGRTLGMEVLCLDQHRGQGGSLSFVFLVSQPLNPGETRWTCAILQCRCSNLVALCKKEELNQETGKWRRERNTGKVYSESELENAFQQKGKHRRRPLGESAHYTVMIMEIALVPSLEMR